MSFSAFVFVRWTSFERRVIQRAHFSKAPLRHPPRTLIVDKIPHLLSTNGDSRYLAARNNPNCNILDRFNEHKHKEALPSGVVGQSPCCRMTLGAVRNGHRARNRNLFPSNASVQRHVVGFLARNSKLRQVGSRSRTQIGAFTSTRSVYERCIFAKCLLIIMLKEGALQ